MLTNKYFLRAALCVVAAFSSVSAKAVAISGSGDWVASLQSRDLDGNFSNGPEAFYDKALNITWLADANFAKTSNYANSGAFSAYPSPSYGGINEQTGAMGWSVAQKWVQGLSVGGITGWRLPTMVDTRVPGCEYVAKTGGALSDCGYNTDTRISELAHMFYVTLGNKAFYDPATGVGPQSGWGLSNTGPFVNMQGGRYWTNTSYGNSAVWTFSMSGLQIDVDALSDWSYAWAVHSGDIGSPVPEPSGALLALMGGALVFWGLQRWRA